MKNNKPTISIKFKDDNFKILELFGKKGDTLPDHEINIPAILNVRDGEVIYKESKTQIKIKQGEYHLIPLNIVHSLIFETESRLELITISNSKIKFNKP